MEPNWPLAALGIVGMVILVIAVVLCVAQMLGALMPWASRETRLQWWTDRRDDLIHDKRKWSFADKPSQARARDRAIEEARMMVRRYSTDA